MGATAAAVVWACFASSARPAVADAGLDAAVARVRAGDAAGALARLDALPRAREQAVDARYLRARLLDRLGRRDEALSALPRDLAALPAAVAVDVRQRRAELLADTGACVAARPIFEALAREGHAPDRARQRAGECALAQGDAAGAVTLLRAVDDGAPGVDPFLRRLRLADALRATGNREAAAAELWRLWIERPDHADAGEVATRLAELGRDPQTLDLSDHLARAERWQRVRLPERAVEELDAAKPPAAREARAAWHHARGMALFKTRTRYPEAARALRTAAQLGGKTEAADAFFAARALSRADRDREAIRAYRAFARRYPNSRRVDDALYLAAWLELRHGVAGGARNMRRFVRDHGRSARRRVAAATFELAMHAYEGRGFARAETLFRRYADSGDAAMVRGRGLYWAGRAAERAGQRTRAAATLREATAVEPLHWYGLLACRRLGVLGQPCGDPFGDAASVTPPLSPISPVLPDDVAFYARLGLAEDASAALADGARAVQDAAPAGRGIEALVAAYRLLGDDARAYRSATSGARAQLSERPSPANAWAWDAAYARPHAEQVQALARAESLPPELLYAIMRKESAFDPAVVSHADAIGLMQLLPSTAARVASDMGVPFRREQLFDPVDNLKLAARLLHQLMEQFDGQAPLVIAAYNAGAHRVEPWLELARRHRRLELDLFVEHIPVEQTRNYVRRVVTNWARYRYLADPSSAGAVSLPGRVAPAASSSRRRR